VSGHASGNGRAPDSVETPVVVRVEEVIDLTLTGRQGLAYESPPQRREQAMALVALLLGCAGEPSNGAERWVAPVAGGRRVITLTRGEGT
jgi:hypothetical protein